MHSTGSLLKAHRFSIHVVLDDDQPTLSPSPDFNQIMGSIQLHFDSEKTEFSPISVVAVGSCLYQWSLDNSIISPKNLVPHGPTDHCPFGFSWDPNDRYYVIFQNDSSPVPLRKISFFDALIAGKICVEEICHTIKSRGWGNIRPFIEENI